jgi:hypothetical protein
VQKRTAAWVLALLGLLELFVLWRLDPPAVLPADAPANSFSAARVEQVLRRLLGPQVPHPGGSFEQAELRQRLLTELAGLGLSPELQPGPACDARAGVCADVVNVVAVVPGRSPDVVLGLVAHYDSVAAGPGAADDGQGAASLLEVARALRAAPLEHGVALVFTDAEELGLLGARLFARQHALLKKLKVVINVEARGTEGPSLMFQVTPGSHWLVARYARSVGYPVASSLFPAVYRVLPNDTDFTIFAQHDVQGLNFAFIGGVERYHTPNDRIEALDFSSVQQQGAAVLALARDLGTHGAEAPGNEAVFFDLLGYLLMYFDVRLLWAVALVSTVLFGIVWINAARDASYKRALGIGLASTLVALALPSLCAASVSWLLRERGALPFHFVATPAPLLLALVLFAFAAQAFVLLRARTPLERCAAWDATWFFWLLLGWLTLALLPQASYLLWLPVAAAALLRPGLGRRWRVWQLAPAVVVLLLLWLPPLSMLYSALGFSSIAALAFSFSWALAPAAFLLEPLLAHRFWVSITLAVAAFAVAGAQLLFPPNTVAVPRRMPLALSVSPEGQAQWLADTSFGPLPPALGNVTPWEPESADAFPWPSFGQRRVRRASAEAGPVSRPNVGLVAREGQRLRLNMFLTPGAWGVSVHVREPARIKSAIWRGQTVGARQEGAWQSITVLPGAERAVSLELEFSTALPELLEVSEIGRGLPAQAASLLEARGPSAVASQLGDVTLIRTQVALTPAR